MMFGFELDENRKLVYIDLSGRLPYEIKVNVGISGFNGYQFHVATLTGELLDDFRHGVVDVLRPFLRRKDSMTELELVEYHKRCIFRDDGEFACYYDTSSSIDWLNENGFDHRGLLANELAELVTDYELKQIKPNGQFKK